MEASTSIRNKRHRGQDLSQEVICFCVKNQKVAAASFSFKTYEMEVMESVDVYDQDFSFVKAMLLEKKPGTIVSNTGGNKKFNDIVIEYLTKTPGKTIDGWKLLVPCFFEYRVCRERIYNIKLKFERKEVLDDHKMLYILTVIDLTDQNLVGAVGALLYYINIGFSPYRIQSMYMYVTSILPMDLENIMIMDSESFRSLEVFEQKSFPPHQNTQYGRGNLCMFDIVREHCLPNATKRLKALMARPVHDIKIILKRHEVIQFCLNPQNKGVIDALKACIRFVSLEPELSDVLSWPTIRGYHWVFIIKNIYYSVKAAEVCKENQGSSVIFEEIGAKVTDGLYHLANKLHNTLDSERMVNSQSFIVKNGASARLDKARERYNKTMSVVNNVTPFEYALLPPYIKRAYISYVPEVGFLLVIPFWAENLTEIDLSLPNLQYKFSSNGTAYYKTERCLQLDATYGDPQKDIIEEETRIMNDLRNQLEYFKDDIVSLLNKIIDLECILALGLLAKKDNYVRPTIVPHNVIDIHDGRNPVLSRCTENRIITNDTCLNIFSGHKHMIYGGPSSGKTVYLRQVGIISYLVHIGSFVPAREVTIGLLTQIRARIHKNQTIFSDASSMLIEFKRMMSLFIHSNERTLIIMGRVGWCSTHTDSFYFHGSVLEYFGNHVYSGSNVLMTSPFSGVNEFLDPYPIPAFVMDFNYTNDQIVYLYTLKKLSEIPRFAFFTRLDSNGRKLIDAAKQVYDILQCSQNVLPCSKIRSQRTRRRLQFFKLLSAERIMGSRVKTLLENIRREYYMEDYR